MNAEILRHEASRTQRDSSPAFHIMSNISASSSQASHVSFVHNSSLRPARQGNQPSERCAQPGASADSQVRACRSPPVSRGSTRTGGRRRGEAWRYGNEGRWLRSPASTCRLSFGVPAAPASVSSWVVRPLSDALLGQTWGLASHIDRMKSEIPRLIAPGLMREIDTSI